MSKLRFTLQSLALLVFMLALTSVAQAQATRTWVSGVGDDVNPCSRTAPCKTWAGAISKTAAGGEIDALDPGGFGTLTITKSLTVDGTTGQGFGSTLNSGGINGFVINDSLSATPNTAVVTLRNLSINGAGTTKGLNGIRFLAGRSLIVDNCTIENQSSNGIDIALSTAAQSRTHIKNTRISNVATTANTAAVRVTSAAAGSFATAHLDNVQIMQVTGASSSGVRLEANGFADIRDTVISAVTNSGVHVVGGAASGANIVDSLITHNGTGINAAGGTSRVSGVTVIQNGTGVAFSGGGVVRSFVDNNFDGNPTPFSGGALTPVSPAKQ